MRARLPLFLATALASSLFACGDDSSPGGGTDAGSANDGSVLVDGGGGGDAAEDAATDVDGGTTETDAASGDAGGPVTCGTETCGPGEICTHTEGGPGIFAHCGPDPCPGHTLSCDCAPDICGPSAAMTCEVTDGQLYLPLPGLRVI